MKSKRITWFVILAFCITIVGPLLAPAPVEAAGIDKIVAELNDMYQYIDDNDIQYIQQARDNIGEKLTDDDWNTILGPKVITGEVVAAFGTEEAAKTELKAFLADFGNIYYSTNPDTLGNTIDAFREKHRGTFQTLFGEDVTVNSLFTLVSNTRNQIGNSIGAGDIDGLAWGDNNELVSKMPVIMKRALAAAITEPFIGKLSAIGWSTDMLVDTKGTIAGLIDPNNNAELALAKAAVRSESCLYTVENTVEQELGNIGVVLNKQVGDPDVEFALRIAGRSATSMVGWESSNQEVASLDQTQLDPEGDGIPILSINSNGKTTITAYRDYAGASAANDWILKFDVTVSPVSAITLKGYASWAKQGDASGISIVAKIGDTVIASGTTDIDGLFELALEDGTYTIELTRPGYLKKTIGEVVVSAGSLTEISTSTNKIKMTPGDINGDGIINVSDLGIFADSYGFGILNPKYNIAADFNGDDTVDLRDLGCLADSYGQTAD